MRQLLIESDPHQTRVAVVEDGRLAEIFLERSRYPSLVGNVYHGRVTRVVPGIDAAFVDIGLDRDAFLVTAEERGEGEGSREAPPVPSEGDKLLVQLSREPRMKKGARVSRRISIPGRRLVLGRGLAHRGVSRRIEPEEERERLRLLVEDLGDPDDGLIVRTVAAGSSAEQLESELARLERRWEELEQEAKQASASSMVWRGASLVERILRDRLDGSFEEIVVEGRELLDQVQEGLEFFGLDANAVLYNDAEPLFERFGLEDQIQAALRSRVWLPSGGTVIIQPTEALVAIDVNTGRYVGSRQLEDTALETNLEAAHEIARQLRLRNLAGIIVVDFIDMREQSNRDRVFEEFQGLLEKDPARNRLLEISEFGLIQVTRKRGRPNLEELLTGICKSCDGSGRVGGIIQTCLRMRRSVLARANSGGPSLSVRVHPRVLTALENTERAIHDELRDLLGDKLALEGDDSLRPDQFEVSLA